jgi:cobalamin-dependent methionine synthase I
MLLAADNLNVMNRTVADALERLDPEPIRDIARRADAAGADYIDLNPGPLSSKKRDRIVFMVETVLETAEAGIILDSADPEVLAKGLAACPEPPFLNAVWQDPQKIDAILPLAAEHGCPVVLLLMDEQCVCPSTMEGKLAIALDLADRAQRAGLTLDRLVFDPILPSLSWPDAFRQIAEGVKTVRMLATGAVFQEPVETMAGLSNLRSGFRGKIEFEWEERCLGMLTGAGLDCILANALDPATIKAFKRLKLLAEGGES